MWYYNHISAKKPKSVTVPTSSNPAPTDVILQTIDPAKPMVDKLRLPTVSKAMIDIPSAWQSYLNTGIVLIVSIIMFLKTSFLQILFHPLPALTPTSSPRPASYSDQYECASVASSLPGTSHAARQMEPVTCVGSGWGLETLDFKEKQEKCFSALIKDSGFQPCYSEQDFFSLNVK